MSKAMIINGKPENVKIYTLEASTNQEALHKCWATPLIAKKCDNHVVLINSMNLEQLWETSSVEGIEKVPSGFEHNIVILKTRNSTYVLRERM